VGALGDEEEPASALVGGGGPADVRRGTAGVADLDDQHSVADEPEADRWGAVADGVGDQFADDEFGYVLPAVGMLLLGVFSSFVLSALTSIVISTVPAHQSRLASGVQNTARQAGALFGIAVIGTVLNGSGFTGRMHIAAWLTVADTLLGFALGCLALRSRPAPEPEAAVQATPGNVSAQR
jgi:hypothetical protein